MLDQLLHAGRELRAQAAQAGPAALLHQVECRIGRRLGLPLQLALLRDRAQALHLVSHLSQSAQQRGVPGFDRRVGLRAALAELGPQAPTIEDRQTQRGAGAVGERAGLQKTVQPQAGQAQEAHQVEVGMKLGARHVDVAPGRLHPPALRHQVGAPPHQVGGQGLGQGRCSAVRQHRRQRSQGARPLPGELGQGVAGPHSRFGQLRVLALRLGQRRLGAAQLVGPVQPGLQALAGQGEGLLPQMDRGVRRLLLGREAGELQVGRHHLAGQQHAGSLALDLRSTLAADGRLHLGALAAEEVQLPVRTQLRPGGPAVRAGHRWRHQAVAGKALPGDVGR